jgi:hypothetical protein
LAVALVVAAHHQPQHERRQHGMALREIGENHQHEDAHEHQLDLRLDHPVAVAAKEPRRQLRKRHDQRDRDDQENREPSVGLDEDRR